jgi:putative drug exporter of the RND superfamily
MGISGIVRANGIFQRLGDLVVRRPLVVIGFWIAAVAVLLLTFPPLAEIAAGQHAGDLPGDARVIMTAKQMNDAFHESGSDNLLVAVLINEKGLRAADEKTYSTLVDKLRQDTRDVTMVQDFLSTPSLREVLQSKDGKAWLLPMTLAGDAGSPQSKLAYEHVTEIVKQTVAGSRLTGSLTGQAATVLDLADISARDQHRVEIMTAVMVFVILLIVYRSPLTMMMPLITIGLSLVAAQGILAGLAELGLHVFNETLVLMTGIMFGAGTDYAVFLISRYHDYVRMGADSDQAVKRALTSIGKVIAASAATVAVTFLAMIFSKLRVFAAVGPAISISVGVAFVAAVTLLPAILVLAGRRGWVKPRRDLTNRFWRRSGIRTVRRPKIHLVASLIVLIILASSSSMARYNYDDRKTLPGSVGSAIGYADMDRHFSLNSIIPEFLFVQSPHDLRTPQALADLEQMAQRVSQVPGVAMLRGITRPTGESLEQAKTTYQAGEVGSKLNDASNQITGRNSDLDQLAEGAGALADALAGVRGAVSQAVSGASGAVGALSDPRIEKARIQLQHLADDGTLDKIAVLVQALPPTEDTLTLQSTVNDLRGALDAAGNISGSGLGSISGLATLQQGVDALADGSRRVADGVQQLVDQVKKMGAGLSEASAFLLAMKRDASVSGMAGFYIPRQALNGSEFKKAVEVFISPDGHATRYFIMTQINPFSIAAMDQVDAVTNAARSAQPNTTLADAKIEVSGLSVGLRDTRDYYNHDIHFMVIATIIIVFLILAALLRAIVAPLYLVGSVLISYLSALGIGVIFFEFILGQELHWSLPGLTFILLVAVGADYNLLLISRIRDESPHGVRVGVIRTVGSTGAVITSAGLIFAASMFGLLFASINTIVQAGFVIAMGILLDTFLVRTITVPAAAALVCGANWWPSRLGPRSRSRIRRADGKPTPYRLVDDVSPRGEQVRAALPSTGPRPAPLVGTFGVPNRPPAATGPRTAPAWGNGQPKWPPAVTGPRTAPAWGNGQPKWPPAATGPRTAPAWGNGQPKWPPAATGPRTAPVSGNGQPNRPPAATGPRTAPAWGNGQPKWPPAATGPETAPAWMKREPKQLATNDPHTAVVCRTGQPKPLAAPLAVIWPERPVEELAGAPGKC